MDTDSSPLALLCAAVLSCRLLFQALTCCNVLRPLHQQPQPSQQLHLPSVPQQQQQQPAGLAEPQASCAVWVTRSSWLCLSVWLCLGCHLNTWSCVLDWSKWWLGWPAALLASSLFWPVSLCTAAVALARCKQAAFSSATAVTELTQYQVVQQAIPDIHAWFFFGACRWSNLVRPATAALKLASNTSAYADSQLAPSRRRQLLSKLGTSATTNQADIADWLDQHSRQYGSYRTSTDSSRSTAAEGTLVFTAGGAASNGSLVDGVTNALIMSGTSRWPAVYSVRELQMSIIALFVVTIVASILQFAVIWLWKLLRFNPEDLPK